MSDVAKRPAVPLRPGGGPRSRAARIFPLRRPLRLILVGLGLAVAGKGALLLTDVDEPQRDAPLTTGSDRQALGAAAATMLLDPMPEPAAGPEEEGVEPRAGGSGGLPRATRNAPVASSIAPFTSSELRLLAQLDERRQDLDERERLLGLRETLLDGTEAQLLARIAELEELKRTIEEIVQRHEEKEEAKLASLVKIYETMKPKAAAEIFDRLEMGVLIEVVARMREAKASDVIGRMDPERARRLTAELAQRRRLPVSSGSRLPEGGASG